MGKVNHLALNQDMHYLSYYAGDRRLDTFSLSGLMVDIWLTGCADSIG